MKDIILSELQAVYQAMKPKQAAAVAQSAAHTIGLIENFANIGRKHGLLGLERYVTGQGDFLSRNAMLIVDGFAWDEIEINGIAEYFSKIAKKAPEQRLLVLMDLAGLEMVWNRNNPHLIEDRLLAMAPEGTGKLLEKARDQAEEELLARVGEKKIEPVDPVELVTHTGIPEYLENEQVAKLTDETLRELDSQSIERLIRDIGDKDIAVAMTKLSGDAVKNLFDAMTPKKAQMLAEDVVYLGPVRIKDVEDACTVIVNTLIKMADAGEILFAKAEKEYPKLMQQYAASVDPEAQKELSKSAIQQRQEDIDLLKEFGVSDEDIKHTF